MDFVSSQSEGGSGLQPQPLVSGEAGQTVTPAACGAGLAPAAVASACAPHLHGARAVFKGTQMGIQVGPGSLGKALESEAKLTDSTLLFNQSSGARSRG